MAISGTAALCMFRGWAPLSQAPQMMDQMGSRMAPAWHRGMTPVPRDPHWFVHVLEQLPFSSEEKWDENDNY